MGTNCFFTRSVTEISFNILQKFFLLFLRFVKKIIAIFLLFIISVQCLPVKELGKSLFDKNLTEEELCKKGQEKNENTDPSKGFFTLCSHAYGAETNANIYFADRADQLLPAPVKNVSTPPPDA